MDKCPCGGQGASGGSGAPAMDERTRECQKAHGGQDVRDGSHGVRGNSQASATMDERTRSGSKSIEAMTNGPSSPGSSSPFSPRSSPLPGIVIKNAKVHNLKGIDVTIPRNSLTVVTGLSGSGKSSLAFDTLYAEGQRRYVESLSAYARQFLDRMEKPDVEKIEGLSPAISIEQHTTSGNPRSIVATVTEIHDYLRILYGSLATPHCPHCGKPVTRQSAEQIVDALLGESKKEEVRSKKCGVSMSGSALQPERNASATTLVPSSIFPLSSRDRKSVV